MLRNFPNFNLQLNLLDTPTWRSDEYVKLCRPKIKLVIFPVKSAAPTAFVISSLGFPMLKSKRLSLFWLFCHTQPTFNLSGHCLGSVFKGFPEFHPCSHLHCLDPGQSHHQPLCGLGENLCLLTTDIANGIVSNRWIVSQIREQKNQ